MKIDPEKIYEIFHRETNLAKGRHVKTVKNFDKAKEKDSWKDFIKCADFINRNNGHIDATKYIKALAIENAGWFRPSILASQSSIKTYKSFIKSISNNSDPDFIKREVYGSIKFIVNFCKEHNLKDFYEYAAFDTHLIPMMLKHYSAGSISMYFLVCIKGLKTILKNYPQDAVTDYMKDFDNKFSSHRIRLLGVSELDSISKNLDKIIEKMIKN